MMVVPGEDELKFIKISTDLRDCEGRIETSFDRIKKLYYDADLDNDDDPYLALSIERTLKRKTRCQMIEEGECMKETTWDLLIIKTHLFVLQPRNKNRYL
jgi:hypothetical protein